MKWLALSLFFLFSHNYGHTAKDTESSVEILVEEQAIGLDSEIEDLLDEELESYSITSEDLFMEQVQPNPERPLTSRILTNQTEPVLESEEHSSIFDVENVTMDEREVASLDTIQQETLNSVKAIEINLKKVFSGAPIIYSVLFFLSTMSVCVWLYSMMTIRSAEFLPPHLVKEVRAKLISNQFDEALDLCVKQRHFFCKMLASGILARKHGLSVMIDTMKAEGKRSTIAFWQRIGILNEIAIIAPMLGLLGTVLGMFYAFYDLNRSIESVSLLFDGLGVSVGTTVAGLLVAILAMILYSLSKYRLVRILANVENEAQTFATLIDTTRPN